MAKKRNVVDQSVVQNAAKTLLANIRFSNVDEPICSIVMTSSVPNEGKSTVSVNLAEAIASSGKRCLIVECDMRKRSLYRHLGVRPSAGIYSVLTDQVSLDQAVAETSYANLFFLDAEPSIPNPADIISSKRFAKLLQVLEERYDYVLLDAPPVGTFIDAAILSSMVDATVFVVRENFAKRDEIANAFNQLKKADANVIGTVLNYCQDEGASSSYYYDYYSKRDGDGGHGHGHGHGNGRPATPRPQQAPVAAARPMGRPVEGKRFKS